ncbi:MAG: macro domain-containing protein [Planctomycetaceae bacterium]
MINIVSGDIFESSAEALANPVNAKGVMGKGLAKVFRDKFPEIMAPYREACDIGKLQTGQVLTIEVSSAKGTRFVINFPTKTHWRGKSKIEFIETGLDALVAELTRLGIQSVAIPPLGCGLGGLAWETVHKMILQKLKSLEDSIRIDLYPPG